MREDHILGIETREIIKHTNSIYSLRLFIVHIKKKSDITADI